MAILESTLIQGRLQRTKWGLHRRRLEQPTLAIRITMKSLVMSLKMKKGQEIEENTCG